MANRNLAQLSPPDWGTIWRYFADAISKGVKYEELSSSMTGYIIGRTRQAKRGIYQALVTEYQEGCYQLDPQYLFHSKQFASSADRINQIENWQIKISKHKLSQLKESLQSGRCPSDKRSEIEQTIQSLSEILQNYETPTATPAFSEQTQSTDDLQSEQLHTLFQLSAPLVPSVPKDYVFSSAGVLPGTTFGQLGMTMATTTVTTSQPMAVTCSTSSNLTMTSIQTTAPRSNSSAPGSVSIPQPGSIAAIEELIRTLDLRTDGEIVDYCQDHPELRQAAMAAFRCQDSLLTMLTQAQQQGDVNILQIVHTLFRVEFNYVKAFGIDYANRQFSLPHPYRIIIIPDLGQCPMWIIEFVLHRAYRLFKCRSLSVHIVNSVTEMILAIQSSALAAIDPTSVPAKAPRYHLPIQVLPETRCNNDVLSDAPVPVIPSGYLVQSTSQSRVPTTSYQGFAAPVASLFQSVSNQQRGQSTSSPRGNRNRRQSNRSRDHRGSSYQQQPNTFQPPQPSMADFKGFDNSIQDLNMQFPPPWAQQGSTPVLQPNIPMMTPRVQNQFQIPQSANSNITAPDVNGLADALRLFSEKIEHLNVNNRPATVESSNTLQPTIQWPVSDLRILITRQVGTFRGLPGQNFEDFLKKFNSFSDQYSVPDYLRVSILISCLDGPAKGVLKRLKTAEQKDYRLFTEKLKKTFAPLDYQQDRALEKLGSAKQGSDQPVATFYLDVEGLVEKVYDTVDTPKTQAILKRRFYEGLRDEIRTKMFVLPTSDVSLEQLVKAAKAIEFTIMKDRGMVVEDDEEETMGDLYSNSNIKSTKKGVRFGDSIPNGKKKNNRFQAWPARIDEEDEEQTEVEIPIQVNQAANYQNQNQDRSQYRNPPVIRGGNLGSSNQPASLDPLENIRATMQSDFNESLGKALAEVNQTGSVWKDEVKQGIRTTLQEIFQTQGISPMPVNPPPAFGYNYGYNYLPPSNPPPLPIVTSTSNGPPPAVSTQNQPPTTSSSQSNNRSITCFRCHKPGHVSKDCPEPIPVPKGKPLTCFNCGEEGHFANSCPKPNKNQNRQQTSMRTLMVQTDPVSNEETSSPTSVPQDDNEQIELDENVVDQTSEIFKRLFSDPPIEVKSYQGLLTEEDIDWIAYVQENPEALQMLAPLGMQVKQEDRTVTPEQRKELEKWQDITELEYLGEELRQPVYTKLYNQAKLQPGQFLRVQAEQPELHIIRGVKPRTNTVLLKSGDKFVLATSDTGSDVCMVRKKISTLLGWTDPKRIKNINFQVSGVGFGNLRSRHVYLADIDLGGCTVVQPVLIVDDVDLPSPFLIGEDLHDRFAYLQRKGDKVTLGPWPPKPYRYRRSGYAVFSQEPTTVPAHEAKLITARCLDSFKINLQPELVYLEANIVGALDKSIEIIPGPVWTENGQIEIYVGNKTDENIELEGHKLLSTVVPVTAELNIQLKDDFQKVHEARVQLLDQVEFPEVDSGIDVDEPEILDSEQIEILAKLDHAENILLRSLTSNIEIDSNNYPSPPTGSTVEFIDVETIRSTIMEAKLGTNEEKQQFAEFLCQNRDLLITKLGDAPPCPLILHPIDTGDAQPIYQKYYRNPPDKTKFIEEQIKSELEAGFIEESLSPWASPVVVVKKKDGSFRMCIDYRELNNVTKKDRYPLPNISDLIDTIGKSTHFITLDFFAGYQQFKVRDKDREKTAFISAQGLFQYIRMTFGLCNAPATFQRGMDIALNGLIGKDCLVYIDDVVIFANSCQELMEKCQRIFDRMRKYNLKAKWKKCQFLTDTITYLGFIISDGVIKPNPDKIQAILDMPAPKNLKQTQSFLGSANYWRKFIEEYSCIVRPLTMLTSNKIPFVWGSEQQEAFEIIKKKLAEYPILAQPDFSKKFYLSTDACGYGIGGVITQIGDDGKEHAICYGSRALNPAEQRYSTIEREGLAITYFVKLWRTYTLNDKFTLITDHAPLRYMLTIKDTNPRLLRWALQLQEYDFDIEYRPGRKHGHADCLSRNLPNVSENEWMIEEKDEFGNTDRQKLWEKLTQNMPKDDAGNVIIESAAALLVQGKNLIEKEYDPRCGDPEPLSVQQENDPYFGQVIMWLQCPKERFPNDKVNLVKDYRLSGSSPNQILQHRSTSKNGRNFWVTCVPEVYRETVLKDYHSGIFSAHRRFRKMYNTLKRNYFWPGMYMDTRRFLRNCLECARSKANKIKPHWSLNPIKAGYPNHYVAIDILGPLTLTEFGNKYILVMTDLFSKWVEAVPLPNQEADTVTKAFVIEWVCRAGTPTYLLSDRGANFLSKTMLSSLKLLDIFKINTTAYTPHTNGQTERFNGTLCEMLTHYVNHKQTDWDIWIPYCLFAYRSSIHSTTGESPFYLHLGRNVNIPGSTVVEPYSRPDYCELDEYKEQLPRFIRESWNRARATISENQYKMRENFNKIHPITDFQIGNIVLVRDYKQIPGTKRKLKYPYESKLYRIVDIDLKKTGIWVEPIEKAASHQPEKLRFHPDKLRKFLGTKVMSGKPQNIWIKQDFPESTISDPIQPIYSNKMSEGTQTENF